MSAGCAAAKDDLHFVVGTAPGARIHSYKVLDQNGSGYLDDIMYAIDAVIWWQLNAPAGKRAVINMSLGGYAGSTQYNSMDYAVQSAVRDYNIPVVVAAGNESMDASLCTPAHTLEAITTGAYASNNIFSTFSNFGSHVDILAPGTAVLTTSIGSSLATVSGTSFACPYVAGGVALYISKNRTATPATVAAELKRLASNTYSGANPPITNVPIGTTRSSLYMRNI